MAPPAPPAPPLLGVAAMQLETRAIPTAENLAHIDALLDRECRRLGMVRWDEAQQVSGHRGSGGSGSAAGGGGNSAGGGGGGSDASGASGVHLDLLVLPEVRSLAS